MSTTFVVRVKRDDYCKCCHRGVDNIQVAHRRGGVGIEFTNDVAKALPNLTKVYATDNTAQGIYTIGDIKLKIQEQNKENE